jgi:hypothetical protein
MTSEPGPTRLKELMSQMSAHDAVKFAIDCGILSFWSRRVSTLPGRLERELRGCGIEPSILLFAPDGTSPEWRNFIERFHEMLIARVLNGWHHGREVFCNFADILKAESKPWPPWLQEFLIWGTRDGAKARRERGSRKQKGRNGRDPYGNVDRDFIIARVVRETVELLGCKPLRNAATADRYPTDPTKESGCSIVAKALQELGVVIGEPGVNSIWRETREGTHLLLDRPLVRRVLGKRPTSSPSWARRLGRLPPQP